MAMDPEQFKKELAEMMAMKEEFVEDLAKVDTGATDAQLSATEPRSAADVDDAIAKHTAAAKESAMAEARAYMDSAKAIISMIAASQTGGASKLLG